MTRGEVETRTGRTSLIALNGLGGLAVLASYWSGLSGPSGEALWGGVPEGLRPVYTLNMLAAAAGYFLFTPYVVFRLAPGEVRVANRFGYGLFHLLYALVLLPSALWLPLTGLFAEAPSPWLWAAVRIDLLLVGIGSLGILLSLLRLSSEAPRGRALAVVGLIPFCFQTAVLDALVWPAYYPLPF